MSLEPIEEKDLDMKSKFIEDKLEGNAREDAQEIAKPDVLAPEQAVERKEGAVEKDDAYSKIISKIQSPSPQTDEADVKIDADITGKAMDIESRINNLVDIAMQKGVAHAVKVAKQLDDNYMLDGFHDKLMVDEFHDALIKKGLIKEL